MKLSVNNATIKLSISIFDDTARDYDEMRMIVWMKAGRK